MKPKTCPRDGCKEAVYIREADEMPTQVSEDGKTKTTFDVVYCDYGHIIEYRDKQEPTPESYPGRTDA